MLVQDFSNADRAHAATLLLKASNYTINVPPPSMRAADFAPPKIHVQINADGSVLVRKDGATLGRVASATHLSEILPRCDDDDPVSIAAGHAVEHAAVIVAMDELRSLGCGHISFSVSQ